MPPSTAIRRPPFRLARARGAQRAIDAGLAFQQSLIRTPPPASGISSPRRLESSDPTGALVCPVEREAERRVGGEGATSAFSAWWRARERELERRRARRAPPPPGGRPSNERSRASSPTRIDLEIVAEVWLELGNAARDDGRRSGRERLEQLGLRARDAGHVDSTNSRWTGPTAVITPSVGRAISQSSRDLAEAPHRELGDQDLGVRLEPGERERDAELGVVAGLGGDRPPVRDERARRGCPSSRSCPSSR